VNQSLRSTCTALDGTKLAIRDWPLNNKEKQRGLVLVVHGLGEHCGRYELFANKLNDWGFAVRGYDHYGHGESGGKRGKITDDQHLLNDLKEIIEETREKYNKGHPLILFGHSMGGLIAARLVSMGTEVKCLILSSPALELGLSQRQKMLLAIMRRIAPDLCLGNELNPKELSHDLTVVQEYLQDPLVHDKISARLAMFLQNQGQEVRGHAHTWKTPTLLLYAGDDRIVSPEGSEYFSQASPTEITDAHCLRGMYHEIFNEIEKEKVYAKLKIWLDSKF
jgi:alpha-beta hydrolase superfamily lysophospholipase